MKALILVDQEMRQGIQCHQGHLTEWHPDEYSTHCKKRDPTKGINLSDKHGSGKGGHDSSGGVAHSGSELSFSESLGDGEIEDPF
eukprot:gnl/Chilomastix_caulleri/3450.p1 GENE.gnl/Chilomastix_caulleri/3450~~gnl/Chilomastix_caulleri/3450.p1  ORF type:complete len:85 (+),score=9.73 gnl/Chilomastix_caulleri/3450:68-322(+)